MTGLSSAQERTLETLFRHPISHNLGWHDIKSLCAELGEVEVEHNGNLKLVIGGESLVVRAAHDNEPASADDVREIRRLFERSGVRTPASENSGQSILLVITHAKALIYDLEMEDSLPKQIVPSDPKGRGRHVHNVHKDMSEHDKPNRKSYYEAIAKELANANEILVFGDGTGGSSEMDVFLKEIAVHHPTLLVHVGGSMKRDLTHLSEDELLAMARDWFTGDSNKAGT